MLNQFWDLVFRNGISAFQIALTKLSNMWTHGITSYIWEKQIDPLANQGNTYQDGGQWLIRVVRDTAVATELRSPFIRFGCICPDNTVII